MMIVKQNYTDVKLIKQVHVNAVFYFPFLNFSLLQTDLFHGKTICF